VASNVSPLGCYRGCGHELRGASLMSLLLAVRFGPNTPHTVFQQSPPKARNRLGRAGVASAQSERYAPR
jgi:hypothetical protein